MGHEQADHELYGQEYPGSYDTVCLGQLCVSMVTEEVQEYVLRGHKKNIDFLSCEYADDVKGLASDDIDDDGKQIVVNHPIIIPMSICLFIRQSIHLLPKPPNSSKSIIPPSLQHNITYTTTHTNDITYIQHYTNHHTHTHTPSCTS